MSRPKDIAEIVDAQLVSSERTRPFEPHREYEHVPRYMKVHSTFQKKSDQDQLILKLMFALCGSASRVTTVTAHALQRLLSTQVLTQVTARIRWTGFFTGRGIEGVQHYA